MSWRRVIFRSAEGRQVAVAAGPDGLGSGWGKGVLLFDGPEFSIPLWPLEILEDVVGQGLVKVGGDRELAGAQAEGAQLGGGRSHGPDFRERLFTAHHKE